MSSTEDQSADPELGNRLVDLAELAWPDSDHLRVFLQSYERPNGTRVYDAWVEELGFTLLEVQQHPKAIEALEAALRVLAMHD